MHSISVLILTKTSLMHVRAWIVIGELHVSIILRKDSDNTDTLISDTEITILCRREGVINAAKPMYFQRLVILKLSC